MTPRTGTSRALTVLVTSILVAAAWARAAEEDWVVRPVRLGTNPTVASRNVDVIVRGDTVSVGYAIPSDPALYLSSLTAGEKFFTHQANSVVPTIGTSFAASDDGTIYFTNRGGGAIHTGADTGGWGLGLVSSAHPATSYYGRTANAVIAVDSHGVPAFVASDSAGGTVLSRFDVPSGKWVDTAVPGPVKQIPTFFQHALAFTPDDRAVVAYATLPTATSSLAVSIQTDATSWRTFPQVDAVAIGPTGVSLATLPNGDIAVAYSASNALRLALYDGATWSIETVTLTTPTTLTSHSLAVDADGHLALVYTRRGDGNPLGPMHLARRDAAGVWTDEALPVTGRWGSVTFDSDNNPYVAVHDGANVFLAGTTLTPLPKADLTLDETVSADDVPALTQAILHPAAFLATRPDLTQADLVAIADRDGDLQLTTNDARLFVDSLATTPLPGLPDRYSGYLALDQADLDSAVGTGTGNFFGTILSTGAPYSPADSRADVSGPSGTPDGIIDYREADLLVSSLTSSPAPTGPAALSEPLATNNPLLDLNLDGVVDGADLHTLIHDILNTTEGDANLDGRITADDFALVDRGYLIQVSGWSTGDFNADGIIDAADYLLLDTAYGQAEGLGPAFLALRQSQFGPDYVQQLLTAIPEPAALASFLYPLSAILLRRRR